MHLNSSVTGKEESKCSFISISTLLNSSCLTFRMRGYGSQNNDTLLPAKNARILIPRTSEYVRLHGKGELRLQVELRLLNS